MIQPYAVRQFDLTQLPLVPQLTNARAHFPTVALQLIGMIIGRHLSKLAGAVGEVFATYGKLCG
jgi:hypothetical protein